MGPKTDDRGRIYLPKDIREPFGERYRIVELPSHVALLPVADNPLSAVEDAVGDSLSGTPSDELKAEARRKAREEIDAEREEHDGRGDEE
ncbi:AbrB/MazE/SpoVT family DNA-binding domain-containing protein [Halobaculum roseum]|uniref:AbrB/MazE/SpoVT family DNA-binding domain-containing protein n=1 Tax=Halobaculum roseum TaxID=2175149 RepID=A0ABD5MP04_9EURY|nr:AbrB/MazE/SpoVT family DNA-binding domain-containing protein [Halobaculum roseum]QZY04212.1 AbrB/MazE/SpoVT family DNA-binding domain-containing protein [Halobaculum roseum]